MNEAPLKLVDQGARGVLAAIEWDKVPFEIHRVYVIYGVADPKISRGGHAHKETDQLLFVVRGSLALHTDTGSEQQSVQVTLQSRAASLPRKLWHTMDTFSADCIAVVVASLPYDESDYIRDYGAFKTYVSSI